MNTIENLFEYQTDVVDLSVQEEVEAIRSAQAGDDVATEALLRQYGRTIRAAVNRAKKTIDEDEARSTALLAFAEVLDSHDPENPDYPEPRLAARLTPHLKDRLGEAQARAGAFSVPKRTLVRFHGIVNKHDGDVHAAAEACEEFGMARETFEAVLLAVGAGSLDEDESAPEEFGGSGKARIESASALWADNGLRETEVEDRLLVETAFRAVDDEEARICELAYGFTEYDPVPDAEIGHRIGLTRPTVQRRRVGALDKMRKATGVL